MDVPSRAGARSAGLANTSNANTTRAVRSRTNENVVPTGMARAREILAGRVPSRQTRCDWVNLEIVGGAMPSARGTTVYSTRCVRCSPAV